MLSTERQRLIEEKAYLHGEVSISELAKEFNVSIETIRRDVNYLSKQNKIIKVHGGAIPVTNSLKESSYTVRKQTNLDIKLKLGEYAVSLIKDNDIVALSSGSTLEVMAQSIIGLNNVTFITNSIEVANILNNRLSKRFFTGSVIVIGGLLKCDEHFTYGPLATAQMEQIYVNKAFVSASGITKNGFMVTDIDEGGFMSLLLKNTDTSYLVAESAKFGKKSIYIYSSFNNLDNIITDSTNTINESIQHQLKQHNINLYVV